MTGPDPAVAAVRVAVRRVLGELGAGDLVLVACSGGPDSYALADAVAFEAPRAGLRAGAVTVDHGLQEGSAARAEALAGALEGLGLAPVEVVPVAVGGEEGPEASARRARYAALDDVAARWGAAAVLLGHTRDDQAETVLLGLARGSGGRALAGMPAASGPYRRPLLDVPRETTRAACAAAGLEPWDDPHNRDRAYARARVRHDALPALEEALGPGVAAALARTARLLADDADALDAAAAAARPGCVAGDGALDVEALAGLPAAVRRRVLRAAVLDAGCPPGALAAVHLDAVDALVTGWRGQGAADLPGGVAVRRSCGRLLVSPSPRGGRASSASGTP